MVKFDNDYTRANSDEGFQLEKDDPEKRASALRTLIKHGVEDLAEMVGVHHPIPNYGVTQ